MYIVYTCPKCDIEHKVYIPGIPKTISREILYCRVCVVEMYWKFEG